MSSPREDTVAHEESGLPANLFSSKSPTDDKNLTLNVATTSIPSQETSEPKGPALESSLSNTKNVTNESPTNNTTSPTPPSPSIQKSVSVPTHGMPPMAWPAMPMPTPGSAPTDPAMFLQMQQQIAYQMQMLQMMQQQMMMASGQPMPFFPMGQVPTPTPTNPAAAAPSTAPATATSSAVQPAATEAPKAEPAPVAHPTTTPATLPTPAPTQPAKHEPNQLQKKAPIQREEIVSGPKKLPIPTAMRLLPSAKAKTSAPQTSKAIPPVTPETNKTKAPVQPATKAPVPAKIEVPKMYCEYCKSKTHDTERCRIGPPKSAKKRERSVSPRSSRREKAAPRDRSRDRNRTPQRSPPRHRSRSRTPPRRRRDASRDRHETSSYTYVPSSAEVQHPYISSAGEPLRNVVAAIPAHSDHIPAPNHSIKYPYDGQVLPVGSLHPAVIVSTFARGEPRRMDLRRRFDQVIRLCLDGANTALVRGWSERCQDQRTCINDLTRDYDTVTEETINLWHDEADAWLVRTMAMIFAFASTINDFEADYLRALEACNQSVQYVQPQQGESLEHYWGRVFQQAGEFLGVIVFERA